MYNSANLIWHREKQRRRYSEGKNPRDVRTASQRDLDRVLYSSAFLRLAGVAQIAHVADGSVIHNRLTHSLKVGRMGRGLAERLIKRFPQIAIEIGGIDPDAVEAAGLAHDIGHPPFGHDAESELNALISCEVAGGNVDGFQSNAQSFRVVTKLAVRNIEESKPGLNLSCATLNAMLKYPWGEDNANPEQPKWGIYRTEKADFAWARRPIKYLGNARTVEAEIMNLADDIAYSQFMTLRTIIEPVCCRLTGCFGRPGSEIHFMLRQSESGRFKRKGKCFRSSLHIVRLLKSFSDFSERFH